MILTWEINDMASYDDLGKVKKSAYVLEAGSYDIYVGTSVRDAVSYTHLDVYKRQVVFHASSWLAPLMDWESLKYVVCANSTAVSPVWSI